ncbi:MAG: sigma-70 family RNA polymerase sigma factor [Isosphaeraceae bacterium]
MSKPDDGDWLARLHEGGERSLADALSAHEDRLRQIIELRLDPRLSGRLDPADVLQESFLEAQKRLPRYLTEPGVPVFVWLRGIVLDTLIDFHRRHLGAKMRDAGHEVPLDRPHTPQASSVVMATWLAGSFTSPSQAAIREETTRQIDAALSSLDPIDREVLILRHFERLTNDEAAAVLGVKKAAASRRYMRALTRFRTVLLDTPGFEP